MELAQSLLARIDAKENLQAWVTIDREEVLGAAARAEEAVAQGTASGALHGVPIGLKDIFYTAGMKTTACSPLYADFVPDYDATVVAKLKEAGAIVLGKAVTTEFATADPSPTLNPWNHAHTPGGSSSGSSVAVATSMCAGPWAPRPAAPPAVQPPTTASWASNPPTDASASTVSSQPRGRWIPWAS